MGDVTRAESLSSHCARASVVQVADFNMEIVNWDRIDGDASGAADEDEDKKDVLPIPALE